ncbi:MAG: diguanylate cyclase [Acidobacteriota bacterium]|nr:diguanylate cyclase [Acidobacteriota bacterium]
MTEATKIRFGFGAGFALLLGIGIAAVLQTWQWEESARWVARTNEVIERVEELSFESKDADDAARRFIATLNPLALARCRDTVRQLKLRETELESLIRDNPVQRRNATVVRGLIEYQVDTLGRGLAATGLSDPAPLREALNSVHAAAQGSNLRVALLDMESEERRLLRERTQWQERTVGMSRILFALASIFSLGLMLIAGWRMSADQKKHNAMQRVIAAKDEQYRRLVELAGDMIFRTDAEGRFTFCNEAVLSILHFTRTEVIGRSYLKLIRQDKRPAVQRFYVRQTARKLRSTYYEFPVIDGHGRERWVGQSVQLVTEDDGITGFQAIVRDISERKRAELELQRSRNFVERIAAATPGILYVYDLVERRNVFSNREVISVLGYQPEKLQEPGSPGQTIHPNDCARVDAHYENLRHAQDGEVRRLEYRARHAAGHWVWLLTRETPFEKGPDGLVKQIVGIAQDVTTRREAQEKLAWQANYDALTGLSNRHHFWTGLQSVLRRAGIDQSITALCVFDIDHFKGINDRYGHAAGDEVLEAVGNIVRGELRAVDVAGRMGGDEFCFALPRTDGNECARVADRIRERLRTLAFGMAQGSPFSVTATFGVAESESHMDTKELMEAADQALYKAKSAGRNRVMVYA